MKQIAKKLLVIVLAVVMTFGCGAAYAENGIVESAYFDMVLINILKNYKFDVDMPSMVSGIAHKLLEKHPEMLEELIEIAGDQMDQYSGYYSPEELTEFANIFNASYVGIGVTVQRMIGSVGIVSVTPGSTAEAAGILAGDRIVKVDGHDVTDFSVNELVALIQGEEGTEVQITVLRDGKEIPLTVKRAAINGNTVGYRKLENGIGYLQIVSFNGSTPGEIGIADAYFKQEGIRKLIIDLRNNPGGELISVVNSISYFVPRGKNVISIEYANESRNTSLRSVGDIKGTPYYNKIVVLVNGETASGGELFAGNIRDHGLGTLVGVSTLGKGTVQEFMQLPEIGDLKLGSVKLTTAEYLLPGGEHINGKGIMPEHWVANRQVRLDTSEMEPLDLLRDYKEGDSGAGVLAIKQRFNAVGYFVGEVNDQYDRELTITVRQYQRGANLPATGVMDYETLIRFRKDIEAVKVEIDQQLGRALELVRAK